MIRTPQTQPCPGVAVRVGAFRSFWNSWDVANIGQRWGDGMATLPGVTPALSDRSGRPAAGRRAACSEPAQGRDCPLLGISCGQLYDILRKRKPISPGGRGQARGLYHRPPAATHHPSQGHYQVRPSGAAVRFQIARSSPVPGCRRDSAPKHYSGFNQPLNSSLYEAESL